jgi:methylmalonyl-CoA/ethylmalonyl-CoA epimerase
LYDLQFSHVDIVVADLAAAVAQYEALSFFPSNKVVWNRQGFHVEFCTMFNGDERVFLVQPIEGSLKDVLSKRGSGTIYRICYTVPDVLRVYDQLVANGVQPENERGEPIRREDVAPVGRVATIWLPQAIGHLSIELLERDAFEEKMRIAKSEATQYRA